MKKLLFFILLFPAVSFAQTELGANIGYNGVYFSNPVSVGFPGIGFSNEPAHGICLSFKIITNITKTGQFGFGVDAGTLSQKAYSLVYHFHLTAKHTHLPKKRIYH